MLFYAERLSGSNHFAIFFDSLAIPKEQKIAAVAKFLGVSKTSISLWLSGKRNPPRAAVIALFHESRYGLSATSTHSENGAALARGIADDFKRRNFALQLVIKSLQIELDDMKKAIASARDIPMNDPTYNPPGVSFAKTLTRINLIHPARASQHHETNHRNHPAKFAPTE